MEEKLEIAVQVLLNTLPIALGGVFGLILAHLRSKRALDACRAAKRACNDEVHCLQNQISDLETAVFVAQARIVGLETELEKRLIAIEGKSAS